jgi:hypothetical protein
MVIAIFRSYFPLYVSGEQEQSVKILFCPQAPPGDFHFYEITQTYFQEKFYSK